MALNRIARYTISRVVVEATGPYELELVSVAYNRGIPVVIAKPSAMRQFARATEQLAKTDKIDARIISEYGAIVQPRIRLQERKNISFLRGLMVRRHQLMEMRT